MLRTRIVKADSGVFVLTYNCPQGSWKQAISPASKRLVGLSLQSPSWESASTSPGLPASGPLVLTPLPILGDHGQVFNTTEEECPKLATYTDDSLQWQLDRNACWWKRSRVNSHVFCFPYIFFYIIYHWVKNVGEYCLIWLNTLGFSNFV